MKNKIENYPKCYKKMVKTGLNDVREFLEAENVKVKIDEKGVFEIITKDADGYEVIKRGKNKDKEVVYCKALEMHERALKSCCTGS